jgi:antitoxin (DNA-binding transcriptional repressor) of toxin-antitoxin stability system
MIANVHEAKSQLSKLLDAVERGEEVVITRRGNGVNRFLIVPEPQRDWSHLWGALKGKIEYSDDYETADAEILADFEASLAADE